MVVDKGGVELKTNFSNVESYVCTIEFSQNIIYLSTI